MPGMRKLLLVPILVLTFAAACTPAVSPSGASESAAQPQVTRTLRVGTRVEPPSIASKPLRPTGSRIEIPLRAFGAELTIYDAAGVAQPLLAEALPQLNT